ncbi:serine/threonine-protein kinase/endoribonuclease IRE1a-like isoform X2 [Andrographis paniculata]|nr:serine/threonine-protein kinase/endoribonuclease IRE1a-like isoform X2 [Andrographis paniculata]
MEPVWSFSSGPQIYSSYQAPINGTGVELENYYFIDCGDDWELYMHYFLGKAKLMKSPEEYISSTPQIAEDGGIVIGSKRTVVFLVDAQTGRVIHTISDSKSGMQSGDIPFNASFNEPKGYDSPLRITRTDYLLTAYMPNSKEVLWNVTVADIGVALLCPDAHNAFELIHSKSSEHNLPYKMPLPCQSRARVYRLRTYNMPETLSKQYRLPEVSNEDVMPQAFTTADVLPSQPNIDKVLKLISSSRHSDKGVDAQSGKNTDGSLPQLAFNENYEMLTADDAKVRSSYWNLITSPLFILVLGLVICSYTYSRIRGMLVDANSREVGNSGGNSANLGAEQNDVGQSISSGREVYSIGKLVVYNEEIAKGSNGTIVYQGIYGGRPVAVKRLMMAYYDIALKESQNLIASDDHPNIVRWHGVEKDQHFVYLALERCDCNLNDIILMHARNLHAEEVTEGTVQLDSIKGLMEGYELWNSDAYPSRFLLKLMRDVVSGIAHLHIIGMIHRDLKPQNVLITCKRSLCAKVSDMGISKFPGGDMSSSSNHSTGCGSSGWQAPEQLLNKRQTQAVDLFSLGCVLFFCVSGGRHPFGNRLERDRNIARNEVDVSPVDHIPEAVHLFLGLLNPIAELRPKVLDVLCHPLFWDAEKRLSFIQDTSERLQLEDKGTDSNLDLLGSLETIAPAAFGSKWNDKLEYIFLNNMGRYRRYNYYSVRDLLRVMRNKLTHYGELPPEIQELLGPVPEGFDRFFRIRFPKLLIEVYKVMQQHCKTEKCFSKYFYPSN